MREVLKQGGRFAGKEALMEVMGMVPGKQLLTPTPICTYFFISIPSVGISQDAA